MFTKLVPHAIKQNEPRKIQNAILEWKNPWPRIMPYNKEIIQLPKIL
jgi:hypothetical protein